jgi:glycosyltransferase involved in cell wall biosynthesis
MHVALVGAHPLPGEPCRGGVERVVQVLRRRLAQRVDVVSLVVPAADVSLRDSDEYGEITYLKRPVGPGFLTYWSAGSMAIHREIQRLNPDIVHVQGMAGDAMFWPMRTRAARHPMVFTAHGVPEIDVVYTAGSDILRRLTVPVRAGVIRAVERFSRRRFDELIAINEYVLEAMPDVAGLRYHLIPNAVDEVFCVPLPPERPQGETRQLLQVGVISPLKNVLASIAIVRELLRNGDNVHLHVIGPVVDNDYYQRCRREIADSNLQSAVTFHGNLLPAEVVRRMDCADALMLVSKQEMAPMVVSEAHCRGLPVAAPQQFGLRSMVTEGLNGTFLDRTDPADDARKIRALLSRRFDRAAIQRDAFARYELGRVVDHTIGVYREALRCAPGLASQIAGL